jgi:MFS family permease
MSVVSRHLAERFTGCHSGVVAGFGLVRRSPGLAGLLAAQTISPLGDAMAMTALILHVQRTTGSATAVGLLLFAQAIPPLAAPLAGVIADRFNPGRLLAVGWLTQAILAGLVALLLPPLGAPARGGLPPGLGRYAAVRGGRPVHPGRGGR